MDERIDEIIGRLSDRLIASRVRIEAGGHNQFVIIAENGRPSDEFISSITHEILHTLNELSPLMDEPHKYVIKVLAGDSSVRRILRSEDE